MYYVVDITLIIFIIMFKSFILKLVVNLEKTNIITIKYQYLYNCLILMCFRDNQTYIQVL